MRRAALLLSLLALGAGTALAQDGAPEQAGEPRVAAREVLRMPSTCRPGDRVTVRVRPAGVTLESMRVHVAGREVVRLTNVGAAGSATVAVPDGETRVTATADTAGGQALYTTRIYNRCPAPRPERPVVGGGED